LTPFGEAGYAFSSERWQYQAGGEIYQFLGRSQILSAGFEIHDRTETQDAWLIGEMENSFPGALFRYDFRDYYRREGWSTYGAYNIHNMIHLTGRYQQNTFESMSNTVNWRLFENKYVNDTFRINPSIDNGRINCLRGEIRFDTRNSRSDPKRGWLVSGLVESAGGTFGGDHSFDRYLLDSRRYQSLGRDMRLDVRLRIGSADGNLPQQYLYDLGGISTMRGFGYKAFTGECMMLFNAEYWFDNDLWHSKWPVAVYRRCLFRYRFRLVLQKPTAPGHRSDR
jgi:outer membrane protein assembly factor BamA